MEANTWEQSDLGPYCLQNRLPKNISIQEEHTTKVVTGNKRLKHACQAINGCTDNIQSAPLSTSILCVGERCRF